MDEPVEDAYFDWLYAKVVYREKTALSSRYQSLLYFLHSYEFVWLVSGDDNRAEDGRELRRVFLRESRTSVDKDWMYISCSVLEMFVAFAEIAAFQTEYSLQKWFWIFLSNLKLSGMSDSAYQEDPHTIGPIVETFVWRTYDSLGNGGLFPLRKSDNDQTEVQIWYQFCEYIIEQGID